MTRIEDRRKAILLRKQGKTYSDIRRLLNIPKSTLSGWLANLPLTEIELVLLGNQKIEKKKIAIERFRNTVQNKRETRLKSVYKDRKKYWRELSKRELELAGHFLYWGEGNKRINGPIAINNTDPDVVKFAMYWMINTLDIPKNKIHVCLHLYGDMNVKDEIDYWCEALNIPPSQFYKPYIKKSNRINIDQKGYGHGTCGLAVGNVRLKERIMMSIQAISDRYNSKI